MNPPAIVASGPLTPKEVAELERLERVVEQGERAFWDTGKALAIIRDKKLHRPKTWKAYLAERFDFAEDRASQLMVASEVYDCLKTYKLSVLPANEGQCRPLVPLTVEQRREAWASACQEVKRPGRAPTAAQTSAAVAALLGVPEGIDEEGGIDEDLAEVLEGLPPEKQQAIVDLCEKRSVTKRKQSDEDPAWLADWKFARSQLKWWEKKGDPPPPVIKALEMLNKVRALLEEAEELRKRRVA